MKGIIDGVNFQSGNYPLNELGRQQAKNVGDRLRHEDFTKVYSSDLARALETTGLILSQNKAFSEVQDLRVSKV